MMARGRGQSAMMAIRNRQRLKSPLLADDKSILDRLKKISNKLYNLRTTK